MKGSVGAKVMNLTNVSDTPDFRVWQCPCLSRGISEPLMKGKTVELCLLQDARPEIRRRHVDLLVFITNKDFCSSYHKKKNKSP